MEILNCWCRPHGASEELHWVTDKQQLRPTNLRVSHNTHCTIYCSSNSNKSRNAGCQVTTVKQAVMLICTAAYTRSKHPQLQERLQQTTTPKVKRCFERTWKFLQFYWPLISGGFETGFIIDFVAAQQLSFPRLLLLDRSWSKSFPGFYCASTFSCRCPAGLAAD
jgi:hypothetical protein